MKKYLIYFLVVFLLTNCNGEKKDSKDAKIIPELRTTRKKEKATTIIVEEPLMMEEPIEEKPSSSIKRLGKNSSTIHNLFSVATSAELLTGIELEFKQISAKEYLMHKTNYDYKIDFSSAIVEDSISFTFETSKSKYTLYKPSTDDCFMDFKYIGFLKHLNSHIVTCLEEENPEMFLINKTTDSVLGLGHPGNEYPLISPQGSKLLKHNYSSSKYDKGTSISIFKINDNKIAKDYKFFETTEWQSKEIVWVNDTAIALKVCDKIEYLENGKLNLIGTKYLKSTIK